MYHKSTLFVVDEIDIFTKELISNLPPHSYRIIKNEDETKSEFLLPCARRAIKEAYIATATPKYIILCGSSFKTEAQNSLLKVLEEPPKNVIFLLVTISKNSILPTILSRVQLKYQRTKKIFTKIDLDIKRADLKDIYSFLKQNQRVSKNEAKVIVESLLYTVTVENIPLTKTQLQSFSTAMKLLELNSRPINILTNLLLTLIIKGKQ